MAFLSLVGLIFHFGSYFHSWCHCLSLDLRTLLPSLLQWSPKLSSHLSSHLPTTWLPVFFLTCKHNLVICVQSFSGPSLPTEKDQIPREGTDGIYSLARAQVQPRFWPYPVLQADWIPGSCQNMLGSFIPLGLWSQCSLLAWDLFPPEVCQGTPFHLSGLRSRAVALFSCSHAFFHPHLYYRINQFLLYLPPYLIPLGNTLLDVLLFYVFIFILVWKDL